MEGRPTYGWTEALVLAVLGIGLLVDIVADINSHHKHFIPTPTPTASKPTLDRILDAIWQVEASRRANPPDGDGGRSIGPYQISKGYWHDSSVAFPYQSCRDPVLARQCVIGYWLRWCPKALEDGDAKVLARTHNGGPRGPWKESTIPYWNKVDRVLKGG